MKKTIYLNGNRITATVDSYTYEQIIALCGYGPESAITVTYSNSLGDRYNNGMLHRGESVQIEEDMKISAYHTSNA